jgi:hypothetical protein
MKQPHTSKPRKKASRFRVKIRYIGMDDQAYEAHSKYMTQKEAERSRLEFVSNGHPEAEVVEDVVALPDGEKPKEGRMTAAARRKAEVREDPDDG